MNKEILHEIAAAQQIDEHSLHANRIEGGFTGAAKYILKAVDADGLPVTIFAKCADTAASPAEQAVLDTEARMYEIFTRLRLTGTYFPAFKGYVKNANERVLLVGYLADVSWGGPWSEANIEKLRLSIDAVHSVPLTDQDIAEIERTANGLREKLGPDPSAMVDDQQKDRFFRAAWQEQDGSFVSSRGVQYFRHMTRRSIEDLLKAEATYDADHPAHLILKDLNVGNLAISDSRAYFVDPPYADIGNPTFDLTVLGVNILRLLPDDTEGSRHLRNFVTETFLRDKAALAHLAKYWVACTSLPVSSSSSDWMDFQQSCAEMALASWVRAYPL